MCPACLLRLGLDETEDSVLTAGVDDTARAATAEAPIPERIGNWRPILRLGEGGMGVVYLAEEIGPLGRRAALKRIKHGLDSQRVLERFEQERRVLARMDHPGIARALDAGAAEDGTPYFVMEYVDGAPITDYCDRQRLRPRERLEVFARLCEAIEHAHRRGILHRDLKPSNILIVDGPDGPRPKVIDFGVARATAQRRLEWSVFTEFGRLIGTPEYMSPEQADLEHDDLDTRSDVYALGVILYELLVGRTPHDAISLRALGLEALLRTIRESSFPTPSSRLSTLGDEAGEIASRRGSDPDRLRRGIAGELDWIVMRATERDRERRYGSPRELAEDVRRFLENQPVKAGPPSASYRVRKFVRRHRVGVLVAGVVFALLLGAVAGTSWGLMGAIAARAETQKRAAELETVMEFQQAMLAEIDMERMGRDIRDILQSEYDEVVSDGESLTFDEAITRANMTNVALGVIDTNVLARAEGSLDEQFSDQPTVEAALRQTIGDTYFELGLYTRALPQMEQALEIRRRLLGNENTDTLESVGSLGRLLVRMGRRDEAETYYREALEGHRRLLGESHQDTLRWTNNMGYVLEQMGRFEEAEPYFREALEGRRRVLGPDDRETITSINNVGYVLKQMGKLEEAQPYYLEALERGRRLLGPDDPDTLIWVNNVGFLLDAMERPEEAEPYFRETLEGRRRVLGDEHPYTLESYRAMGNLLRRLGRLSEAQEPVRRALDGNRRVLGDDHPETQKSLRDMGRLLQAMGQPMEAERYHLEAIERGRRTLPETDFVIGLALHAYGETLIAIERYDEAEETLLEAYENLEAARGTEHQWTHAAAKRLIVLYNAWGKPEKKNEWRARLAEIE
jgi:non-specific serine/threonine protein kinase/serine/threonine-protein kinase